MSFFVVFDRAIQSKKYCQKCGVQKKDERRDGDKGEVAHRGGQTSCTLWKCIFQHFRWVEDIKIIERIVEIWSSVIKIMNDWMSLPSSQQPRCSYSCKIKIQQFYCWSPKALSGHLPVTEAIIPFLYNDLQSLYKELIGLTIKPEVLGKCDDDYNELHKIDLLDVKNYMKKKDIHVGFGMQQELLSILKRDCVTQNDVNKFRIDAREFLVALLEKMFDKNPI